MDLSIIKPLEKTRITPQFVEIGLSLMRVEGFNIDDITTETLVDLFNTKFGVSTTSNDFIPFFILDIELEDVRLTYEHCAQIGTETLYSI
mgnify:CR=1 FL=1